MIVRTAALLVVLAAALAAGAAPYALGDRTVEVPAPEGFVRVAPRMDTVHRLFAQLADPDNDLLAAYIAHGDTAAAAAGALPPLRRYFLLKVLRSIRTGPVDAATFGRLKAATRQEIDAVLQEVMADVPGMMDERRANMREAFDIDYAMTVVDALPLDAHEQSDDRFAYSMVLNADERVEGRARALRLVTTTTMLRIGDRVVFLYAYGPEHDLVWSRDACRRWADAVRAANAAGPASP